MSLALLVYFASIVDGLRIMLFAISTLFAFGAYFLIVVVFIAKKKNLKKPAIIMGVFSVLLSLSGILIPKEKTIYIMAGAYATEQIAMNDRVQKIGNDVLLVIEGKLAKMKEDNK